MSSMNFIQDANLKAFHTFGIEVYCDYLIEAGSIQDYINVMQKTEWDSLPKLILGKGSNVLFTERFHGVVVINNLLGKTITEDDSHVYIQVQGGEDWPSLVQWSLAQGFYGLENLALIPGCAGSAPIQNIGAYGIEFKDICQYVEYLDLNDLTVKRLSNQECQFGYRDSIFKRSLREQVIITSIGLKLSKQWQPNLSYGPLQAKSELLTTPIAVFNEICAIRRSKLPDPKQTGNAGSFFKNPIISQEHFNKLKSNYSSLSGFEAEGGMKIAAGWLIDQCGLKGYEIGGAQVHPLQALVLINTGNATAQDVLQLAQYVKQSVLDKFEVDLEHEVRFIGAKAETRLEEIFC